MPTDSKETIDILIISDIHLGDKHTRCGEVYSILSKYEADKIILNGDILNGLHFNRLHTEHWKILSKLRKLTKDREVIWVHGNHDASAQILSRLLGIKVCNKYVWKYGGKKYLAIHGHQFDRFMHNNAILSWLAFALYTQIKKIDKKEIVTKFIKKHSKTWHRNSLEVARGAIRFGRMLKVDVVICGHTHMVMADERNGVKYYNTGSWVEKPSAYIVLKNSELDFIKDT